jgi:hypothetical protein
MNSPFAIAPDETTRAAKQGLVWKQALGALAQRFRVGTTSHCQSDRWPASSARSVRVRFNTRELAAVWRHLVPGLAQHTSTPFARVVLKGLLLCAGGFVNAVAVRAGGRIGIILWTTSRSCSRMATHKIMVSQPSREVVNVDYEFEITRDNLKLGTLKISKGGIDWKPMNKQYQQPMDWKVFADLLNAVYVDKATVLKTTRSINKKD